MKNIVCIDLPSALVSIKTFKIISNADEVKVYFTNKTLKFKFSLKIVVMVINVFLRKNIELINLPFRDLLPFNPKLIRIIENSYCVESAMGDFLRTNYHLPGSEAIKYVKRTYFYQLSVQYYISRKIREDPSNNYTVITTGDLCSIYDYANKIVCLPKLKIGWLESFVVYMPIFMLLLIVRLKLYQFSIVRKVKERAHIISQVCNFGAGSVPGFAEKIICDVSNQKLLITPYWPYPGSVSEEDMECFYDRIKEKSIDHIHYQNFSYTFFDLVYLFKFILSLVCSLPKLNIYQFESNIIYTSFYHFIDEYINSQNFECKGIICHDDVSMRHFIRTSLFNQKGTMCFGVQHSAGSGLFGAPHLAYVFFNKYIVWNKFIKKKFEGLWDDNNLVMSGYRRMDDFLACLDDKHRCDIMGKMNNRFSFHAEEDNKNILITLPSVFGSVDDFLRAFENSAGMMEYLCNYSQEIGDGANIIIRPKRRITSEFIELVAAANPRIVVCDDFSVKTPELIVWADLVVASGASGVIIECSLLQTPVVSFDYHKCQKELWVDYGESMCLSSAQELKGFIADFCGKKKVDVDWDLLWADMGYHDKKNIGELIESQL